MHAGGCGCPRSWWVISGPLPRHLSGALRSCQGSPRGTGQGPAVPFPRAAFWGRERARTKALGSHGKQMAGRFANCPHASCLKSCCSPVTQFGLGNDSTLPAECGVEGPGVSSELSPETKAFIDVQIALSKATKMSAWNFSLSSQVC